MTAIVSWFALAALLSALLTAVSKRVALHLGVVARPCNDRWNRKAVPLLGGVAIAATVLVIAPFTISSSPQVSWLFAGAAIIFLLGLIDDIYNLKPQTKLGVEILVAASLAAMGFQLRLTPYPVFNVLLTLFWVVGITNAFNLLDNMDGLGAGIAAIAAGFRLAFFLLDGNHDGAALAAVFAGAAVGFLFHNFSPASIFMGDAGSLFTGFFISGLSLAGGYPYSRGVVSVLLFPVLLLLVPIFDTTFVTVTRTLARRPVSMGGRDHTSHRLVALGLSERRAVVSMYAVAAASGGIATVTYLNGLSYTAVLVVFLGLSVTVLGLFLSRIKVYPADEAANIDDSRLFRLVVTITHQRQVATLALDVMLIALAYYTAYILRFEDAFAAQADRLLQSMPIVIACQALSFLVLKVHHGVWRYTGVRDAFTIAKAAALGTALTVVVVALALGLEGYSHAVFFIDAILLMLFVGASRLSMRFFEEIFRPRFGTSRRVLLYGADDQGVLVCRGLLNNPSLARTVVGFIDDDPRNHKRRILGIPVLGDYEDLADILRSAHVDEVLISSPDISPARLRRVATECEALGVPLSHAALQIQ
ncbi:MAG: hypothetical protein ACE148_12750 [Vicinamibacterales bacterium]